MGIFAEVVEHIRKAYNPLFSYSLIICGLKQWDDKFLDEFMQRTVIAASKYPEFIIGFDLV